MAREGSLDNSEMFNMVRLTNALWLSCNGEVEMINFHF